MLKFFNIFRAYCDCGHRKKDHWLQPLKGLRFRRRTKCAYCDCHWYTRS